MRIIHAKQRVLSRFLIPAILGFAASGVALSSQAQVLLGPLPPPPTPGARVQPAPVPPADHAEPSRWTQEDLTPEQKLATAQKEAKAAYQVQLDICKIMHPSEKPGCIAQAKVDFQQEMSDIAARFGVAR